MLHRVIGPSGSGKTEYIISCLGSAIRRKKRCFLIVPEQQSVSYESLLCERFGDGVNMYCEVLNFERLPNRIARDYGGLAVNNIDKGGACALLSLISESLKPQLTEYASLASDTDFALSLFSLISRMKMGMVTPSMLRDALDGSLDSDEPRLVSKLHDISLIYAEYEKRIGAELNDPRDALTRLADTLEDKPFFDGAYVFIDGYYNYTEQEYAVLKPLLAQAAEVYVSFTFDTRRAFFAENERAAERIKKLCRVACEDVVTDGYKRSASAYITHIEKNLWQSSFDKLSGTDGSVRLITASNRFDETEAAAAEILKYVRDGGRFRDVTLLAGNTDTYSPLVDAVFARAEIPCYMSSKESLVTKPLFSFLLSSLSVLIENFSLRSVKRYVKSGYTSLTPSETDALLNYTSAWKLQGKAWYGEDDWTLDPEGYREGDITPRGAKLLEKANLARKKILPALTALKQTLHSDDLTVSKGIRALYEHLMSMSADETLRKSAEAMLVHGERERSERETQQWKLLINIIDQLDSLCGDIKVTPKRLQSLIKLMCDCYSLGAIPASNDSVTFGDARLLRAGGSRLVIILGVCDGEFPYAVSNGGFFDRDEAVTLEGIGLKLADTMEQQLNEGRFFAYSAMTAPTDRLVLLSPRSELGGGDLRPSAAWISVKNMLPDVEEYDFSADMPCYSRETVASAYPSLCESELKTAIERALTDNNIPFFRDHPQVCDPVSRIDFKSDTLNLSPSRFEKYSLCPFSFFGNYLLNLKEKKENAFSMSEIGNFAHKILEQFMRACVAEGSFRRPNDTERRQLVESLARKYLLDVIGHEAESDKRFMHTYSNMIKTVDFVAESLCDEFAESKFVPTGFEFKIGLRDADIPAIEYDADGKKVYLRGSIDRVDTYEKNGVRYVRVVDYKTYSKSFSADLVSCGLDTQLLHYLFAYCEKTDSKPAGALYYTVTLPNVQINGSESQEEISKALAKKLTRSGILLNDPDVVFAMSPDCSFVPVSRKADGTVYSRSNNLLTEDEFDSLGKTLTQQVQTLAKEVFCGNMDVAPNDVGGKADPCKYCSLADLCRSKKHMEVDDEIHTESD